jgi:hypothetical protein
MAKPNYSFEKRQRELAKKKKKEEKAREKADRKSSPGGGTDAAGDVSVDEPGGAPAQGSPTTPPAT